jgi:hypothetical protein
MRVAQEIDNAIAKSGSASPMDAKTRVALAVSRILPRKMAVKMWGSAFERMR